MKKLISLLLAVVLIGCTFAACGSRTPIPNPIWPILKTRARWSSASPNTRR